MAIQQTGTGYRDATKALSIKALQQRQKDAAANAAAAMAPQAEIASPWQGVGHIANILGSGFTQARAENAEGDARARLAEIVAGIDPVKGATAEQQAQVRMLDEEFANKIYEEAAKARAREDEQRHAEQLQTERFGHEDKTATTLFGREKEKAVLDDIIADENATVEERRRAAQQKAEFEQEDRTAATLAETNEQADINKNLREDVDRAEEARIAAAAADQTAANQTEEAQDAAAVKAGKMTPEVAAQKAADRAAKAGADIASTEKGTPENLPEETAAREAEADRLKLPPGPERDRYILTGEISGPQKVNPADAYSPGQAEMDKKFAPEVLDWDTVGGANMAAQITQVNKALDLLEQNAGTALGGDVTGLRAGLLNLDPTGVASAYLNPDGTIAREAIQETVQATLRATLGSQFTEKEGERLMARAFNPALKPEENIRRARILLTKIQSIAANKAQMIAYYKKNGASTQGYQGPTYDPNEVLDVIPDDAEGAGGGGGAAEPPAAGGADAAAARRKKYGLEE